MNEETINFDEAMSFIARYCDWNPLDDELFQHAAAARLIAAGITGEDLDRLMHQPFCADFPSLQDWIDGIIWPDR